MNERKNERGEISPNMQMKSYYSRYVFASWGGDTGKIRNNINGVGAVFYSFVCHF